MFVRKRFSDITIADFADMNKRNLYNLAEKLDIHPGRVSKKKIQSVLISNQQNPKYAHVTIELPRFTQEAVGTILAEYPFKVHKKKKERVTTIRPFLRCIKVDHHKNTITCEELQSVRTDNVPEEQQVIYKGTESKTITVPCYKMLPAVPNKRLSGKRTISLSAIIADNGITLASTHKATTDYTPDQDGIHSEVRGYIPWDGTSAVLSCKKYDKPGRPTTEERQRKDDEKNKTWVPKRSTYKQPGRPTAEERQRQENKLRQAANDLIYFHSQVKDERQRQQAANDLRYFHSQVKNELKRRIYNNQRI